MAITQRPTFAIKELLISAHLHHQAVGKWKEKGERSIHLHFQMYEASIIARHFFNGDLLRKVLGGIHKRHHGFA